ncbi:MAG: helix-turn-helix transcriptional regulator [Lachnospiraceae bacterium]|nr:helix-turn-helix transcriptional regulator [Lachnospiraceae bacterium]
MDNMFGENLRKLREEKGLSQKQLGQQVFVSPSAIANWEIGRRLPDAVMILRLAKCHDHGLHLADGSD